MNMPKHSRKIFDPLTGKAEVITFNAWLGSGIKDKNGKEIFEGDKVKVGNHGVRVVHFSEGVFTLGDVLYIAQAELENNLEVVGHIAQD